MKINTCKRPLLPYLANDPLLIKIHIKLQIEMQMMGLQSIFASELFIPFEKMMKPGLSVGDMF